MEKKCKCLLPYVRSGENNCIECGYAQYMFFLPIEKERPISVKREFNGTEFKPGDIVEVIGKSYSCLVEIIKYSPEGWYYVRLPNGGVKETQILGDLFMSKLNKSG